MTSLLFEHMEQVRIGRRTIVREKRTPSEEQRLILDDLDTVERMIIRAGPGAGKSTSLEMICEELYDKGLLSGKVGFISFNTRIVKEVKKKFPGHLRDLIDFRTVNSLGNKILTEHYPNSQFEPNKYRDLIFRAVEELYEELERKQREQGRTPEPVQPERKAEMRERTEQCLQLHVGHDLGLDIDLDTWVLRMDAVDAPIASAEEALYYLCMGVLKDGIEEVKHAGKHDFLDQTLIPSLEGLELAEKYDVLLVDELQDNSKSQIGLLQASAHSGTRIIGVGDEKQSIYSFQGADQNAMRMFELLFNAKSYTLSVSYRCPVRVVEMARTIFPDLQPAPGAKMGTVDTITESQFTEMAQPGDLVIARTNAPLVAMCYTLISAGIPAKVSGRDVSTALRTMTKNAACFIDGRVQKDKYKTGISTEDFLSRLDDYSEYLLLKAEKRAERTGTDPGMQIMTITDRNMVIKTIAEASGAKTVSKLLSDLGEIFKGDSEDNVLLATAHAAKGLESPTVFILEAGQFPSSRASSPAEIYAERCAEFVAYSRAMERMFFIGDDAGKIPDHIRGWEEG